MDKVLRNYMIREWGYEGRDELKEESVGDYGPTRFTCHRSEAEAAHYRAIR